MGSVPGCPVEGGLPYVQGLVCVGERQSAWLVEYPGAIVLVTTFTTDYGGVIGRVYPDDPRRARAFRGLDLDYLVKLPKVL